MDDILKDIKELSFAAGIADTFHGRDCCSALDRVEDFIIKTISAAPTPAPTEKVDVDSLERHTCNCEGDNGTCAECNFDWGWNACIDHLASRGYLPSVQRIDGLDESINEFIETVKDCVGEIHYPHKDVLKAARAYAELQDGEAITTQKQEWRPIESAPHGVWILIFAYGVVCQACWNSNGYWTSFNNNRIALGAATHWMPLPMSPKDD